jgi:hypothetical protein
LPKVLITTVPFGEKDRLPLDLLENAGIKYLKNPFNKKITEDQLTKIIWNISDLASEKSASIHHKGVFCMMHLLLICLFCFLVTFLCFTQRLIRVVYYVTKRR